LRIGGQRIPVGKPVTISDEVYAAEKSKIDGYAAGGLISLKMTVEAPKVEPPKPKRRTRGKAKPKPKVVEPVQEVAPPVISPAPPVVQEAPEAPVEKEAKESRLFRRLRKKSE
tara:strand:- start:1936 stop:2274 length:339 start_codon:yes stop_codon:yes gene_type:complete